MNGAIEGMLAVLEDPRAEAGRRGGGRDGRPILHGRPAALRPYKVRFRKMLSDRDVGVRGVAAWALAHTGDLDVIPRLIDVLVDPQRRRRGRRRGADGAATCSRARSTGYGPPSPSTPEQRKAAAQKWREWFEAIRPLDLDDHDEGVTAGSRRSPRLPPARAHGALRDEPDAGQPGDAGRQECRQSPRSKPRCWASRNTIRSRRC